MENNEKQSKFAGCDISALKEIIRNIDKDEDPEFYDEIHTLIIGKEFGEMAEEEIQEEEEYNMAIYTSYDIRELKSLLRKTSKKERPNFYDELQTLIVTREFGNMSKSIGRVEPTANKNPFSSSTKKGGISPTRSSRRVGGSGLYNK